MFQLKYETFDFYKLKKSVDTQINTSKRHRETKIWKQGFAKRFKMRNVFAWNTIIVICTYVLRKLLRKLKNSESTNHLCIIIALSAVLQIE